MRLVFVVDGGFLKFMPEFFFLKKAFFFHQMEIWAIWFLLLDDFKIYIFQNSVSLCFGDRNYF